jgi:riboflavin kinase
LKSFLVKGKVFSGKSEATRFTELPWMKKQITEKLGFTPYSGTLNVKLTEDCLKLRSLLKRVKVIQITPATSFCHGRCFQAYLMDVECAIVIPEIANYPSDVIEVIAPMNLREKLQLEDGDTIEIKISLG